MTAENQVILATGSFEAPEKRRLAGVVWPNSRASVDQVTDEVNAGSDEKQSDNKVHCSLLGMALHSGVDLSDTPVYSSFGSWGKLGEITAH